MSKIVAGIDSNLTRLSMPEIKKNKTDLDPFRDCCRKLSVIAIKAVKIVNNVNQGS